MAAAMNPGAITMHGNRSWLVDFAGRSIYGPPGVYSSPDTLHDHRLCEAEQVEKRALDKIRVGRNVEVHGQCGRVH